MSDSDTNRNEAEDRPLVDDLAEQVDNVPGELDVPTMAGGLEGNDPEGDRYEERDEREGGRA